MLKRTILLLTFLTCLAPIIQAQELLIQADTGIRKNDLGLGISIIIPTGFYRQHLNGVYPGLCLSFYRNIGKLAGNYQFVGGELNWTELQTKSADVSYVDGQGRIQEFTSIADAEMLSLQFWYRMQPDLNFILWPYLEAGPGLSWFYTMEKERYPGEGDEESTTETDFLKNSISAAFRFGFGIQYLINDTDMYLDLAWRYTFHTLSKYDRIDRRELEPEEYPVDLLQAKRSHATSGQVRLSFNFIF